MTTMYPKNPLFQKCLTYLESLPNIQATIQGEPYCSSNVLADGKLIIQTPHKSVHYICEIKTDLTNDTIEQTVEYFLRLGERITPEERPLLITRGLSNLVVDQLVNNNIEFIDADGRIYLNSPGVYALVHRQNDRGTTSKSLEITAAVLQVTYALLSTIDAHPINSYDFYERISHIAGVNPSTVRAALKKLEQLNYLEHRDGKYNILDYVKLLERWELGYAERLRSKLLLGTFAPIGGRGFSDIQDDIKQQALNSHYLIGGELAASVVTDYLRPMSTTLYVDNESTVRHVAVKLKLKPDPKGSVTFFTAMGKADYQQNNFERVHQHFVSPLLIHAELVSTGNSRLKETAQIIYDRYIEALAAKA